MDSQQPCTDAEHGQPAVAQQAIVRPDLRGYGGENLRVTFRGVDYKWVGGFGCIIESYEVGVKQDEVRQFGCEMLYAWKVDEPISWSKRRICWSKPNVTTEWIREFKKALFSV